MVSTRTQDGTISTKTYSPLTLDLNALSLQNSLPSVSTPSPLRSTRSHGPGSPTKVLKPSSPRKSIASRKSRSPRTPTLAKKQKFANFAASEANASASAGPSTPKTPTSAKKQRFAKIASDDDVSTAPKAPRIRDSIRNQRFANISVGEANASISTSASSSTPKASAPPTAPRNRPTVTFAEPLPAADQKYEHGTDLLEGNTFFPSITIGAKETTALSKIGRADKEVQMWEGILEEHEDKLPSLVPVVKEKLWEAKHRRACMDGSAAENVLIGDVNPAQSVINSRLEVLEWGLSTSKFEPEAENIKCAIAGYKSGEIGYSDRFTVIYAAHIVNTVATYSDFARDRTEMLDRYFEMYGPGWMWYEPPLNVHPETTPKLFPSVALERQRGWTALDCWHVTQGFWKRAGFVSRMAQASYMMPGPNSQNYERHPQNPDLVNCQDEGPRLSFRCLLDSGATFPSLHVEDLQALNIDSEYYSAQSVTACDTAGGTIMSRLFELFVCVLDNDGKQLVDPDNAVYPYSHKYLGGMCPVVQCRVPLSWDPTGIEIPSRLSGILPFLASYVSSTPTRDTLYLGEDRNSVLGAHRMPGQRKWSIELGPLPPGLPFDRYGEPKIRFWHRNGRLVDEDDLHRDGVSHLSVIPDDREPIVVTSDPATRQEEMRAREERERVEEETRRMQKEEEDRIRVNRAVGGLWDVIRERGGLPGIAGSSGGAGGAGYRDEDVDEEGDRRM